MSRMNKRSNTEVVEMYQKAVDAGNVAWDAANEFHGKFVEASAAVVMLPEIRVLFYHIC